MRVLRKQSLNASRIAFPVAAAIVVLDQVTKIWAVAALSDGPIVLVPGFLRLALFHNTGAAFSILQDSGVVLALIGMAIVVAMVWMVPGVTSRLDATLVGLVMGGAVGNLIDRFTRGDGFLDGAVVDWIDFDFWPTFNVADSAISIGIVAIMLASFRRQ